MEKLPELARLFDRSKCENVITSREECNNEICQVEDDCRLERGSPYCFAGSDISRALLDPYWIGGPAKHVKRTAIRWIFILHRDMLSPPIEKLKPENAIELLAEGNSEAKVGPIYNEPFFNPHVLVRSMDRTELQKRYFKRLLNTAPCYLINTGRESVNEIQKRLKLIINGNENDGLR